MKFDSKSGTLLPLTAIDFESAGKAHVDLHATPSLLAYDSTAGDFWFEFAPLEDIEAFINNARFAVTRGKAFHVDHLVVADYIGRSGISDVPVLQIQADLELPSPLRFDPIDSAFAQISETGSFRGQLTICSCGISGCFAQYAVVDSSICHVLFTISGASLVSVDWRPFRFRSPPA